MRNGALLLPLLALTAACDPPPQPAIMNQSQALPPEICGQVRDGLDKLKSQGAAEIDDKGNVLIEEQVWLAMPPATRDQLVRLVAFHAACALPEGAAEQEVIVRGESGQVLSRRTIETSIDPNRVLGGDDGP